MNCTSKGISALFVCSQTSKMHRGDVALRCVLWLHILHQRQIGFEEPPDGVKPKFLAHIQQSHYLSFDPLLFNHKSDFPGPLHLRQPSPKRFPAPLSSQTHILPTFFTLFVALYLIPESWNIASWLSSTTGFPSIPALIFLFAWTLTTVKVVFGKDIFLKLVLVK